MEINIQKWYYIISYINNIQELNFIDKYYFTFRGTIYFKNNDKYLGEKGYTLKDIAATKPELAKVIHKIVFNIFYPLIIDNKDIFKELLNELNKYKQETGRTPVPLLIFQHLKKLHLISNKERSINRVYKNLNTLILIIKELQNIINIE